MKNAKAQFLLNSCSYDLGKIISRKRAFKTSENTAIEGIELGQVAWYRFASGMVAYSITEGLCVFIAKNGKEAESLRDLKNIFS